MQQLIKKDRLNNSVLKNIASLVTLFFVLTLAFLVSPAISIAQDINTLPANTLHISLDRQKELTYMVQQDCGSCHGMTLKGGLGPSLLPERVSVLPKQYLIEAVTHGRQGTPMPPWEPLLTKNEIEWIVEQLQLGQLAQKKQN